MKKALFVLLLLPILLIVLAVSAYTLIASEAGTRWLLTTLAERSGQQIELQGVQGNLLRELFVQQLHVQHCAADVTLQDIQLRWHPRMLLQRDVSIAHLSARQIDVIAQSDCPPATEEPFALPAAIELPVEIHLDHFSVEQIRLTQQAQTQQIGPLALRASVEQQTLHLDLQQLMYTTANLQANTSIELHQPYPLQASLQWSYVMDKENWQGQAQLDGDLQQLQIEHVLKQPYAITSQIQLHDLLEEPGFESVSRWSQLEWVAAEQSVQLRDGRLQANGSIDEIHYQLESRVDTEKAKDIQVSAKGTFAGQTLTLAPLTVQHKSALLQANGQAIVQEPINVQLDLQGKNLDPAVWQADYPGNIALDSRIAFSRRGNRNDLQLNIRTLQGELRGFPLAGQGEIQTDLQRILLDQVQLAIGDNHLQADGQISEQLNVQIEIEAPQLEHIHPQVQGDLSGHLHLQGTREQPQLDTQLQSNRLQYGEDLAWQQFALDASVRGLDAPNVDAQVSVAKLQATDQNLQNIALQLQGTEAQHSLELKLHTQQGDVQLLANGGLDRNIPQWQGVLTTLEINNTQLGDWRNAREVQLTAGTKEQQLRDLCLQQRKQQLCIDFMHPSDQPQSAHITLENFDLSALQPMLQAYANLTGLLQGEAELQTDAQGKWRGQLRLHTQQLALTTTEESDFNETLRFDTLQLQAELDELTRLQAKFNSNRGHGGAQLQIRNLQDLDNATISKGSVTAELPELVFLNPYLREVVIKQGRAEIDLRLSGRLLEPGITGQAEVTQLGFYLPELGTEYQDTQLTLKADDITQLNIAGEIKAQQASLQLQGQLDLSDPVQPAYQLHIAGTDFPVIDTVDYQANVSPDLQISGNTKGLSVDGRLDVPRLHIILKELPAGVDSVSADEVIADSEGDAVVSNAFVVTGNVDLSIGNDAHFTGYGLQTDLRGGLKITLQEKQPAAGHGVLSMYNAKYTTLGQSLDISKGDIIFAGPLEDPSLDAQIKRSAGDVTVTMLITGKASDPQTRLVSDPALSEANKLSYLLTGRGINELQSGEGADLTSAALSLGLTQGSSVIQEIGTKFGLDTLSVEASDNGVQSTSVLLGKHLSPRLYITYAKDLFSALGAIQLNYRLTDHISVEVESGTRQTVDLIYSISTE